MSIWVVINPHAAAFARDAGLARAVAKHADAGAKVRVTESLAELESVAREIMAVEARRVVLCGGDGTYMAGVSALAAARMDSSLPELVLAPGGTVATVGRNLGQGRNLLDTVRRATSSVPDGVVRRSPTLSVVEDSGASRVGFIFGSGLVARFFERYYSGNQLGYVAAARIVGRVFIGSLVSDAYSKSVLDPLPCKLVVEGTALEPSAFSLVLCSVVRDVGLHLWVCHRAAEDDARPHLVASSLLPRRLGPRAHRVLLGRGLKDPHGFDDLVSRFRVEFPDVGAYVLDGDLLHAKGVEVSAGPVITVRSYR